MTILPSPAARRSIDIPVAIRGRHAPLVPFVVTGSSAGHGRRAESAWTRHKAPTTQTMKTSAPGTISSQGLIHFVDRSVGIQFGEVTVTGGSVHFSKSLSGQRQARALDGKIPRTDVITRGSKARNLSFASNPMASHDQYATRSGVWRSGAANENRTIRKQWRP